MHLERRHSLCEFQPLIPRDPFSIRNKHTCNYNPGIPFSHLCEGILPFVTTKMKPMTLKEISQAQKHQSWLSVFTAREERQGWGRGGTDWGYSVSNVLVSAALQGDHSNSTSRNCWKNLFQMSSLGIWSASEVIDMLTGLMDSACSTFAKNTQLPLAN